MKLVTKEQARDYAIVCRMTGGNDMVEELAATILALWPVVEWTAKLPCTILNCTPEKHHPSCVPGQAKKFLAVLAKAEALEKEARR